MKATRWSILVVAAFLLALPTALNAQTPAGTAWTYQGQLKLAGEPLNDSADFQFELWDTATGGSQVGSTVSVGAVSVVNGLFTVALDFGADPFATNEARWLQIAVRSPAGHGGYTTLSPRQPVTATPFSLATRGISVDANGNVGIGTTTPAELLDVAGTAQVNGIKLPPGAATGLVLISDGAGTGTWQQVSAPGLADGSVDSAKIQDGTILFIDIAANGAKPGQVMKWNGTAWECADDVGDIIAVWGKDGLAGGGDTGEIILSIAPAGVTSDKIADGAVGDKALATAAVTNDKLATSAVGNTNLMDAAVDSKKIAAGGVERGNVADLAINASKLDSDAVTTGKILDGSVQGTDLANLAVDANKLAADAVTSAKILDATITFADIAQNSATNGQVMKWSTAKGGGWTAADDADTTYSAGAGLALEGTTFSVSGVTSSMITDGTIATVDLENLAVTDAKLATDAVLTDKIKNSAVTRDKLNDGAVDTSKLNDAAVNTAKLNDAAVTSSKIEDASILFSDIGQNDAATGQVMKWNGTAWSAADDETGSGGGGGGWVDDGSVVRLETVTDAVGIGTATPAEKLDVNGNIHASGALSSGASITIDGTAGEITSTSGAISFGSADVATLGRAAIGPDNTNTGLHAFVVGQANAASGDYSGVLSGRNNIAEGRYSVVCGGGGDMPEFGNHAVSEYSVIGGGYNNVAGDSVDPGMSRVATVGGGSDNQATGDHAVVAGGNQNRAAGDRAGILGGNDNQATAEFAIVVGGSGNHAEGRSSFVGGGGQMPDQPNSAQGEYSVVVGGSRNMAQGRYSFVGGGGGDDGGDPPEHSNFAEGVYSVVVGGSRNWAVGRYSVICGGGGDDGGPGEYSNEAEGECSFIGGGRRNQAGSNPGDSFTTIGGGYGNQTAGQYSAIPGGCQNHAVNDYAFAAGAFASAEHSGAIVIAAHAVPPMNEARSGGDAQMVFHAGGGLYITNVDSPSQAPYNPSRLINTSTGAYLNNAGQWMDNSDRNRKENFAVIDTRHVLERIAALPISQWNYKADRDDVKHVGPMAQDFKATFDIGADDKAIAAIDVGGVSLAGIQGLYNIVNEKDARIASLEQRNEQLEARLAKLETLVAELLEKDDGGAQ